VCASKTPFILLNKTLAMSSRAKSQAQFKRPRVSKTKTKARGRQTGEKMRVTQWRDGVRITQEVYVPVAAAQRFQEFQGFQGGFPSLFGPASFPQLTSGREAFETPVPKRRCVIPEPPRVPEYEYIVDEADDDQEEEEEEEPRLMTEEQWQALMSNRY
jgi:hypothetical protein